MDTNKGNIYIYIYIYIQHSLFSWEIIKNSPLDQFDLPKHLFFFFTILDPLDFLLPNLPLICLNEILNFKQKL